MKTTNSREANEITFHVSIDEMINNCFDSLKCCIESDYTSQPEQLDGIQAYMQAITTLKSGSIDELIKLIKDGWANTMIPELIGNWDEGKRLKLSITLDNGYVLIVNHENIIF